MTEKSKNAFKDGTLMLRTDPKQMELLRVCVSYAIANSNDLAETTMERRRVNSSALDELRESIEAIQQKYAILNWVKTDDHSWTALLGTENDGVVFHVVHYPTCYRRGPWRLLIEVLPGEHHHDCGCFDEDDQPVRNYHCSCNLLSEAERIASVLLTDRLKHGEIDGYSRPEASEKT